MAAGDRSCRHRDADGGHDTAEVEESHVMTLVAMPLLTASGIGAKSPVDVIEQLRRLGASCDWSRERFTMDEVCPPQ